MKKLTVFFLSLLLLPFLLGSTYNYSFYGNVIHSSPGMTYADFFDSAKLGTRLRSPEYFIVYNNEIYAVDSGTNSLLVIDENYELKDSYTEFKFAEGVDVEALELKEGSFIREVDEDGNPILDENDNPIGEIIALTINKPEGIDAKDELGIYIADTQNGRIVRLNHDFEVINVYQNPEDQVFETTAYQPEKITVDVTGRMYVVAKNIYEGIIELSNNGKFNRYVGVNPIQVSALDIFRRSLMSEEQLMKLTKRLPTTYRSVMINEESFMYATANPRNNDAQHTVQLINPKGLDVINRNGYFSPMGDIHYIENRNNYVDSGPSTLVDIAYTDGGIYSVLDQKRSRIFTYDSDGNLLYINGSSGSQRDKFSQGVSLNYFNDDLIVLDRINSTFIVYQLTEFGKLVNEAIYHQNRGDYENAFHKWEEILAINANYEIAYNGLGKYHLREGDYKEALENFKLGHDTYYYSKAYKEYRNEKIRNNFGYIFGGIVVISGLLIGRSIYKKRKKGESLLYED